MSKIEENRDFNTTAVDPKQGMQEGRHGRASAADFANDSSGCLIIPFCEVDCSALLCSESSRWFVTLLSG